MNGHGLCDPSFHGTTASGSHLLAACRPTAAIDHQTHGRRHNGRQGLRFTSNLRDAISSVCRNQAEGFAKYKHKTQKPYFNTARSSLKETEDGIRDGELRGHFSKEIAKTLNDLCDRASAANLRYLQSLNRPDPD